VTWREISSITSFGKRMPVQRLVYGTGPNALKDTDGRAIDGAHNGKPGSNALAILSGGGAKVEVVALALKIRQANTQVSALVDALFERHALVCFTQAIRGDLDRRPSREGVRLLAWRRGAD
jgi:hypothetical protein